MGAVQLEGKIELKTNALRKHAKLRGQVMRLSSSILDAVIGALRARVPLIRRSGFEEKRCFKARVVVELAGASSITDAILALDIQRVYGTNFYR